MFGGEENISARRLYFAVRVMLHFHRKRFKGNMNKIPTLEAAPDIILDLVSSGCLTALLRFNILLDTDQ